MTDFGSNDPSSFGWTAPPTSVVPFAFMGQEFAAGLHPLAVPIFRQLLTRLVAAGLQLHPGPPTESGDWGYEDRMIRGSSNTLSFHAYGIAIDVNAPWNGLGDANPPATPWRVPDSADSIARPLGILWGGAPEFSSRYDRMHFELHRSPAEIVAGTGEAPGPVVEDHPYPLPTGYYYGPESGPTESISGYPASDAQWRPGLELAQRALGVAADGLYGMHTAAATHQFQQTHGLQVDALIGPHTWSALNP